MKLTHILLLLLSLLLFIPALFAGNTEYIVCNGTGFEIGETGRSFYYAGTNCYYLMTYAADQGLRHYVDEVLEEAEEMGLNVVRTGAFNDAGSWNALQTAPGVFDEQVFCGLDYVLARADEFGLRLILPLVNYWEDYGGMDQYVEWSPTASQREDFYTDRNCMSYFRNYIHTMLHRINTVNGRLYKEDPTVLAWELANEPRNRHASDADFNTWVGVMSSHIKNEGARQLVAIGSEGFDSNFIESNRTATIDFATIHAWPQNFGGISQTPGCVRNLIRQVHSQLNKPVIVEEFGVHSDEGMTIRDSFYQQIYDVLYEERAAGSNFWILYHDNYDDYDGYGVYYPAHASTISIIMEHAKEMNLRNLVGLATGQEVYSQGDTMNLELSIGNSTGEQIDADLYIVLEVMGEYYFYPDLTPLPRGFLLTLPSGFEWTDEIFSLALTEPLSDTTLTWYAAFLDHASDTLLGDIAQQAIRFSPVK